MNATGPFDASDNPFCTRRIRPGAIPFLFPPGQNAESLVEQLRQAGWWGEIVGPHGSGKSALLATLIPAIERAGPPTTLVTLHDGQRRLPLDLRDPQLRPPLVLIVDGYEQLGRWQRWLLRRRCRRRGIGLLATAHSPVGFPPLCRTAVTPEVAAQVVNYLLGDRSSPFPAEEVSRYLSRRGGDLRETLFDLYDLFEQRRPS
jgi:hypothetical protein